jgi:hypothetical protein
MRTTTRLACPARAMLLVIIATMVWGNAKVQRKNNFTVEV